MRIVAVKKKKKTFMKAGKVKRESTMDDPLWGRRKKRRTHRTRAWPYMTKETWLLGGQHNGLVMFRCTGGDRPKKFGLETVLLPGKTPGAPHLVVSAGSVHAGLGGLAVPQLAEKNGLHGRLGAVR